MIIVSQDKNTIINFNNITEIVANGTEVVITDNIYKDYGETIGIYKTEERAKEVLQEIKNAYSAVQLMMLPTFNFEKPIKAGELAQLIAYEMPKE